MPPTAAATSPVAVLGMGLMGAGIAQLAREAGRVVRTYDPAHPPAGAEDGQREARASAAEAVADAAVIFEAAPERLDVKRDLLREVDAANPSAIIASNTSTFMPSVLSEALSDPSRLVIAHFFNPAAHVPLVEVVRGPATADTTVSGVVALLEEMGKVPVVLQHECPGFVANRLQAAMLREAFALTEAGVVDPAGLDLIVRLSLGPRWAAAGPFQIADLGGLDVFLALCAQLFPDLANHADAPDRLRDLVAEGHLGAKSGRGVHVYEPDEIANARQRVLAHLTRISDGTGGADDPGAPMPDPGRKR